MQRSRENGAEGSCRRTRRIALLALLVVIVFTTVLLRCILCLRNRIRDALVNNRIDSNDRTNVLSDYSAWQATQVIDPVTTNLPVVAVLASAAGAIATLLRALRPQLAAGNRELALGVVQLALQRKLTC